MRLRSPTGRTWCRTAASRCRVDVPNSWEIRHSNAPTLATNIESIKGDQQMRRLNVVLIVAAAIAAAIPAGNRAVNAQAPKEWKIGALFPFSGPLAFLGQETFRGAEIASQIINDQGGINGTPIVWEKADAGTPAQARTEAERLANSGIKVVFGTNSSAQAIAASQVLEKNEV